MKKTIFIFVASGFMFLVLIFAAVTHPALAQDISAITKGAELGDAKAQLSLGNLYIIGLGVPQSNTEAEKWFLKAAEQGNIEAQRTVGHRYSSGRGGVRNDEEAYFWLSVANSRDDTNEIVAAYAGLSPELKKKTDKRIHEWKPSVTPSQSAK